MRRLAGRPLTLSFGASAGVQALNVLTGVLLARTLGPHGRGELAAVLLWPSILAAIGSLGILESTTFHAARSTAQPAALLGTSLAIVGVQAAVCVAAGIVLVPHVLGHYDDETVRVAYLYLAFIPLNLITLAMMSLLNGLQRFAQFHALRLLVIGGSGAATVALRLADELTVRNVAIAYLAANLLTGIVAAALIARVVRRRPRVDARLARHLLVFGLQSHSGNVSGMMNERLDQLVISAFLAPARLGLYVTALTLSSLTNLAASSIATAAFPVVAALHDVHARQNAVRRYARIGLLASVATAMPLIVVAPWVNDTFFKDVYSDASNVARVLLVAAIVLSTNRVLGACLSAVGRPMESGVGELMALGVTVAGLAAFLPLFGIMGAAVVSLLAYGVSTCWLVHRTARALDMPVASLLLPARARRMLPSPRLADTALQGSEP
jgi:O-antigen/teichoic acid export membrane protein